MKYDSGSHAMFSEQGSSASQMTAAKVLDVLSRLPGCAGQASDAVSAHAYFKMEDAQKLLKCLGIGMSRHLNSITTLSMAKKSWRKILEPHVPLERNLCGHLQAGLLQGRQFEKVLIEKGWVKALAWVCTSRTLAICTRGTTSRWLGRETIYNPYGKDG